MGTGPEVAPSKFELGRILELRSNWAGAVDAYWQSIDLDENIVESCERLADLYTGLRYCGRSRWYAARAARLRNFDTLSLQVLARTQYRVGKLRASLRTYRLAMRRSPADPRLHSAYLMALLHDERQTPSSLKEANEGWFRVHCPDPPAETAFANLPDPARKLRLGYLCCELRESPGRHFFLPILQNHDRQDFEIYCYHMAAVNDSLTEEFKKSADYWRDAAGKHPDQIKEQILRDGIDVLIERSGHIASWQSGGVFQRRAAPVQAAYLNYPCTTGCHEIDYFISDRWTTPDDEFARQYAERAVYRMPSGSLFYRPYSAAPEITDLPASSNGYLTFGLFQRPAKFNSALWDAIAGTLQKSENARLLVQHADNELEETGGEVRNRVLAALRQRGVANDRVDFLGGQDPLDHLRVLATVDIALDTFPYNGATTTCACLWMGVPVVTLAGAIHASRIGCALLSRVGLEDWVARSVEEYVQIAASKANSLTGLAQLRSSLRARMRESSLCRPEIVVRELEQGYRWMWREWCLRKRSLGAFESLNQAAPLACD
jgi:predicted O-linked N-acetylglucosamine transferase (SPINDLY family)